MAQTMLRGYLQETEDAISAGHIEDALANCQHILAQYPDSLEAQRLLGEVYLAQGQLEKAQQAFDWVLTNDPENVIAYCSRALISERMQDYDTALDCYQQAYELSRGNSQIRQEFNQLSVKVGQEHFIFSRAGLARLYTRGDLLPQAIQEWETVLSITPERLDARTGLLEAYWREGLYDKVEELARQILDEIPGCLKALLLLAHVTYAQNTQQAQQLLQRAEALDPDMVMAQELFSDFMASQPNDPFLALLKRSPATLQELMPEEPALLATANAPHLVPDGTNGSHVTSPFSDSLLRWDSLDSIIEPEEQVQAPDNISSAGNVQEQDVSGQLAGDQPIASEEAQDAGEAGEEEQPWYQVEMFEEREDDWIDIPGAAPGSSMTSWEEEEQEAEPPSPPAWLEMLTSSGWRHAGEPSQEPEYPKRPVQSPEKQEIPAVNPVAPEAVEPAPATWEGEAEPLIPDSSSRTGEDIEAFGPEWLRSLGATLMDEVAPPETDAVTRQDMPVQQAEPAASTVQEESEKQESAGEDWLSQVAEQLSQPGQDVYTTLEALEKQLHSQGFIPLEPGTLSTIAHEQEQEKEEEQEPTLSSALAQFGNLNSQPASEHISTTPVQPVEPASRVSSGPTLSFDALSDTELETTMKRPAVRLQPIQRSPLPRNFPAAKGQPGEREASNAAPEGNLTYKERLIKGYQYQLAGSYDEAMQEYRIIIRNAPELLAEVVSNMRALLKVAPKYAPGYRVLGDAYMRQGEYLQAMEAYNKALSMAKRARGQNSR